MDRRVIFLTVLIVLIMIVLRHVINNILDILSPAVPFCLSVADLTEEDIDKAFLILSLRHRVVCLSILL